jgi:ankyrin repeat protein
MSLFRVRLTSSQLLLNAVADGNIAEVRTQLAAGGHPDVCDRDGVSAIGIAASRGWTEVVAVLLEAGADPSQHVRSSRRGGPAGPLLNFPCANGSLETVGLLVAAGAALDDADPTGVTPLMAAAYMGHGSIVALLCEAGAGLELRDHEGLTALMFGANAGSLAAVEALLAAGADVAATADDGSTPLMFAAQHGHDDAVVALMYDGADPETEGGHGYSAIRFAKENGHTRTLSLLLGAVHGNT